MPKKIRHMEGLNRISFLIVLVGIVAILGIYCINKGTSDIAVINGQTISKEEYALM